MSRLIPDSVLDKLRDQWDTILQEIFSDDDGGPNCTLRKRTRQLVDKLGTVYQVQETTIKTYIKVDWTETRKLRAKGVYSEHTKPIAAWMRWQDNPQKGDIVEMTSHGYTDETHRFEIIDVLYESDDPVKVRVVLTPITNTGVSG